MITISHKVANESAGSSLVLTIRFLALSAAAISLLFVLNNFLIFWQGWPGIFGLFAHLGWFGFAPLTTALNDTSVLLGWLQLAFYLVSVGGLLVLVLMTPDRTLRADSEKLASLAAYIVRAAFWSVLLIGIADAAISFMRVEGLLIDLLGPSFTQDLGRASFRGMHVHYPLIMVGFIIALFTRTLGFVWLALLIVIAELLIVITRFVFSYEQAFMGDLVRFWYAALFLFASAYTLMQDGHVRVDVLYSGFSERLKAWSNTVGTLILGIPVCWTVLIRGMWGKSSLINAPILSYEVTQNGYGLYVKYLMAGFLLIYALSMMIQFISYFLKNVAVLVREPEAQPNHGQPTT